MFLKVVVFCLCAAYVVSEEEEFNFVNSTDCVDEALLQNSINVSMEVSGCSFDMPVCPLIKGTNHTVALYFTPTENFTDKYFAKVIGVFPKFTVPYGRFEDACELTDVFNSTETCASLGGFLEGVSYVRNSLFPVNANYPSLSLKVRFLIQEKKRTKRVVMCQEIPVVLVNAADVVTNEAI